MNVVLGLGTVLPSTRHAFSCMSACTMVQAGSWRTRLAPSPCPHYTHNMYLPEVNEPSFQIMYSIVQHVAEIYLHRRFAQLLKHRVHHLTCTWLGMFGAETPKPVRQWSNRYFVHRLKRSASTYVNILAIYRYMIEIIYPFA